MEPHSTSSDELTPEQTESQNTLKTITGLTDDIKAKQYLEMCTWNLEQAVNLVLEGGNFLSHLIISEPLINLNILISERNYISKKITPLFKGLP